MDPKTNYQIDFVYADDQTIFSTNARLDADEKQKLEAILEKYCDVGVIENPNVFIPVDQDQEFLSVVGEITDTLNQMLDCGDESSSCQNCGTIWPNDLLNPVEDLSQRVAPGDLMPSGECSACGTVCHPDVKAETP